MLSNSPGVHWEDYILQHILDLLFTERMGHREAGQQEMGLRRHRGSFFLWEPGGPRPFPQSCLAVLDPSFLLRENHFCGVCACTDLLQCHHGRHPHPGCARQSTGLGILGPWWVAEWPRHVSLALSYSFLTCEVEQEACWLWVWKGLLGSQCMRGRKLSSCGRGLVLPGWNVEICSSWKTEALTSLCTSW